jgi:hypothetical protein
VEPWAPYLRNDLRLWSFLRRGPIELVCEFFFRKTNEIEYFTNNGLKNATLFPPDTNIYFFSKILTSLRYAQILGAPIEYADWFSADARDFVSKLLNRDPKTRPGPTQMKVEEGRARERMREGEKGVKKKEACERY